MATPSLMTAKNAMLVNKWKTRINLSEGIQKKNSKKPFTLEQKVALAVTLENTDQRLKLIESTNPSAIGQYKRYALDIVNAVVPNLIAYDLCSVQPIDNRVGMINYILYEYGRAKGQAQEGQMFASSLNMGQSDPNYTANSIDLEVLAESGQATITTNVQWTPVVPGSFFVTAEGGTKVGQDDGNGNITGTGITSGTINYATGEVTVTFDAAPSDEPSASYRYNNEDAPIKNVPEVNLRISSLPVIAQSRKMKAVYAFDAAYELEKEYGQNIDTLLATEVAGEISHEIDMELANDMYKMAGAGVDLTWSKTQPVGVNNIDHYDSFYTKLIEGANVVFGATRKVQPNFMICGLGVSSVVQVMRNFTPSNAIAIGPHFIGTLGALRVYVSPDFGANDFVLGYKGTSFMDAGMFYCPYMPIVSTDLLMTDDFAGRKGWATMYAKKMVNNKMYLRGHITD